ncbi:MAG: biotin--[acetyl-CoA-carboxylase] ligase [Bacteroidales bacterium]|jgi:BirA family biotin operon repressor/biotin-[acetyl-CoA-carboxylase] ligase|nr:biotin--[acetyl-CoA-carboxylase] ligase [Bacteroidales bacterium]
MSSILDIRVLDVVSSTNDIAKELILQKKVSHGSVIRAHYQTKGKGRQGNSWESNQGENLLFSIIITPQYYLPSQQFILNQLVSVTLADFLQTFIPDHPIKIKWPNDLYVNDKKLAGMLIEHTILGNTLSYSIIGIGVNVNQISFEKSPNPVSLRILCSKKLNIDSLCVQYTEKFLHAFEHTNPFDEEILSKRYHAALYQLNEVKTYLINGKKCQASILGTTKDGRLMLQHEDGAINYYELNSLKYL